MSLKYTCPSCGTPLGYEGLCWKCKCEQERQAALAWTPEQIVEKQRNLIQNIQRLADMEDPEFADFWQLLGYHDVITPEIQRMALAAEVFWPCEIYYHAPADVRDGLIHALLSAEYSSAASNLMSCLAMQGDDKAMETLLELERNPRPWRKGLYVDPSSYAQIGGWTFDKEGKKIQLNFDTCYPMVKGTTGEKSPVRIGREREDTCPHCGGRMVDILVLDGRDERLKFLGLDGILTATCCPSCVGFLKGPAFNRFTLDGGVEVFPSELFDGAEKTDCYVSPEEYKALTENPFVLDEAPVPLFYGAACQDVNTIGGFANWVQDAEYTTCPHCGKPMKYLVQIQWDMVFDCAEGTLYVEFCPGLPYRIHAASADLRGENAMKKRTIKDFIALYAPKDEEKLVLIQDGISADKTFLDTFWAAHTHALAMADVRTGQVISGRCYLSWPLTDKERDAGDYSKRFAKGQIYRIKARGWKGDALSEPQWYVMEVLEEGVPCPALEEIWTEYTKPILLEDEVLGTLTLDREMSTFEGTCKWMGNEVHISLDVDTEKKASWTRVTNVMKKLVAEQEVWDKSLRAMAAQKLTAQANEWLADNDQTDRDPEKDPITEDELARRILLTEFTVSPGGRFTAWYEDDDMFWGHVVTVDGTLKKGPVDADIQG